MTASLSAVGGRAETGEKLVAALQKAGVEFIAEIQIIQTVLLGLIVWRVW